MLSKKHRLNKSRVEYTLKKGRKLSDKYFNVKFINSRADESRFSVVVSLKTAPKSTLRNRLRRQIYEAIRTCGSRPATPKDIVITAKRPTIELSYDGLKGLLDKIFKKING